MWIDSHCHLDASEFGGTSLAVAEAAAQAGVSVIVVPAVHKSNFDTVIQLGEQRPDCFYALGIHPMYVPTSQEDDLLFLREKVSELMAGADTHKKLVAIGEIGLDYFVPALTLSPLKEKQEYFYTEQLKLARDFDLPVLLHVRRSQDIILKHLRRIKVRGGIAHAFNGSAQQAQTFIDMGFKLGFGGAMTFTRALQIRRLATDLPLSSIVLETDAPDIPPSWLPEGANTPDQLPKIGAVLAELRHLSLNEVAQATTANAMHVMPRMQRR
ncbi:TatD family hydrolase [Undibacterium sp. Ji42W]|uniref:TatD family hydrolase n=1 Tax=Undibacterium sp. Ji42W TaxID=3413039 RepID=UPI003BEF56D4